MLGNTLMGMLPAGIHVKSGSILFDGQEISKLTEKQWNEVRGSQIALVMQDPFTSLNPVMRVGDQVAETIVLHLGKGWSDARHDAVAMFDKVGIPDPERSANKFPHEMSGGQRQRVVIATAFACKPKLLIADEPTTALDVTLQAQILRLLKTMQEEEGTAVILISHNVGVIAAASHGVAVMYAGQVVEHGPTQEVLKNPQHPYTTALLDALPDASATRLVSIGGQPPQFQNLDSGCAFRDRCSRRFEKCSEPVPESTENQHQVRCWLRAPIAR